MRRVLLAAVFLSTIFCTTTGFCSTETISLDGVWTIRQDSENVGKGEEWFASPLLESGETFSVSVPGVLQEVFREYHGVVWYEREFQTPENFSGNARALLRFWQAEYRADVWLNGSYLGWHEGGEEMFELDASSALKPIGESNRLTVRVLDAANEPIDGISMANIPRRNNTNDVTPGCGYASGGLVDSVELLVAPNVRIADLHVIPNWQTGEIEARVTVDNATETTWRGVLRLMAVSCDGGEFTRPIEFQSEAKSGVSQVVGKLIVPDFKLWDLNDPNLYSVSSELVSTDGFEIDRRAATCGFRDFRFENGYFRLNGKRIYVKCSHSGSDSPITHRVPLDPDLYRKDILICKTMGFNMIRYIAGMPRRFQLDLCDRIGFLVYDECLAGWCFDNCPERLERYEAQTLGMIRRDRNHPSVVAWGLLNETLDSQLVLQAAALLPTVRELDPDRVVFLNSGSFDAFANSETVTADYGVWRRKGGAIMPGVIKNGTDETFRFDGTTWFKHTVFLHPGDVSHEYCVLKWTAPQSGSYDFFARFTDVLVDGVANVDLHLIKERLDGSSTELWSGYLNLNGAGGLIALATSDQLGLESDKSVTTLLEKELFTFQPGETLCVVVGIGDSAGTGDTTAIDMKMYAPDGSVSDVTEDYSFERNPNGVWSYGWLPRGPEPDMDEFKLFDLGQKTLVFEPIGRFANPGSSQWQNELADTHPYKPVPHTGQIINELRTHEKNGQPVFLSEYGIGSAVDLFRLTRFFEQYGAADAADAKNYHWRYDNFNADWNAWKLDEVFATQEDFFRQAIALMAEQRRIGINAIRANQNVVAHSVTGTHDQGFSGEGLTTIFRELKPGAVDAMADVFAPLRFCNFVEPAHVAAGDKITVESVLVNEDVLGPGEFPVRYVVVGPNNERIFDETRTMTIPTPEDNKENPIVMRVFSEEITIPEGVATGECRFFAEIQEGGAAAGGVERFFAFDRADMPSVGEGKIYVWGDDEELLAKLSQVEIAAEPFTQPDGKAAVPTVGDRILVGKSTNRKSDDEFSALFNYVRDGVNVVFLSLDVFAEGNDRTRYLPFEQKGQIEQLPAWLYHKDDWNRRDSAFDGLESGGAVDYVYYRDVVPALTFRDQYPAPDLAIAGGFNTQMGYQAGLTMAEWNLGKGRAILSTWLIQETLPNPLAERLMRNLLNKAR